MEEIEILKDFYKQVKNIKDNEVALIYTTAILNSYSKIITSSLENICEAILTNNYINEEIVDEIMTLCNLLDIGE